MSVAPLIETRLSEEEWELGVGESWKWEDGSGRVEVGVGSGSFPCFLVLMLFFPFHHDLRADHLRRARRARRVTSCHLSHHLVTFPCAATLPSYLFIPFFLVKISANSHPFSGFFPINIGIFLAQGAL